ncbi:MAG: LPS assembly protein LptD, partial [Shewanella sp.]
MQIRYFVALSLLPFTAMAIDAPTPGQCVIIPPIPMPAANSGSIATSDVDATHDKIIISSDSSNAIMGDMASFQGDVRVSQGDRLIKADEAVFHQQQEQLNANGNLIFQDSLFTVTADSLVAKMRQNTAVLTGANYWLHGQQVHGEAQELQITPDNNLLLKKTNFTTCPPENLTWLLEADRIKIDSEDEWGEIWDAKLKLLGVPVLYIPYMTVPVSDKRKSGLLFPSISSSTNNGLEVTTPYYWNIAPEYDLTFTPHAMTNRGLFLQTEFRYLGGEAQQGQINLGYLGNDRLLDDDPNRYMYHWQHQGAIDENWRVLANYTEVSDDNYFNDLPSDINQSTDNQLNRIGEVSYFQRNWDTSIRVQDIKVLGAENEEPYKIMPQISANYRLPDVWHNLDFAFSTELTNFEHNQDSEAKATRLHMEPSLTLPIYVPAGSLTTELKLYQTNYWQRELNQDDGLGESVSRTIPQARIHGQINFERNTSILGNDYRQTLEPQAQYLYVGYEDQSDIGLYDTAALADDFYGLFRDSRYSSVDRIANANQVTIGATTT